jgi:hypothetical protein
LALLLAATSIVVEFDPLILYVIVTGKAWGLLKVIFGDAVP